MNGIPGNPTGMEMERLVKYLPFVSAALLLASACPAWALEPANPKANAKARALLNYLERLPQRADKRLLSGQFTDFGPPPNWRCAQKSMRRRATGRR